MLALKKENEILKVAVLSVKTSPSETDKKRIYTLWTGV